MYPNRIIPASIVHIHRVVVAIRKHIASNDPLSGGGQAVGVDEAAKCRIVIAALEVIQLGLGVVVVAPIPERIHGGQGARRGQHFAPGVVAVLGIARPRRADDLHHVALQVRHIVVPKPVVPQSLRAPRLVVEKLHRRVPAALRDQSPALPGILVLHRAAAAPDRLRQAQAVRVKDMAGAAFPEAHSPPL